MDSPVSVDMLNVISKELMDQNKALSVRCLNLALDLAKKDAELSGLREELNKLRGIQGLKGIQNG